LSENIKTVAHASVRPIARSKRPPGVPGCDHEEYELIESVFEEFPSREYEVRRCKSCGEEFEVDL